MSSSTDANNQPKQQSSPLPPCAICNTNIAIYRCPRCHTGTCSLKCCKAHKESKSCNGKRDRTQFCSLNRFTDTQLASDYHFLEDVLKVSEGSKRLYQGIVTGDNSNSKTTAGAGGAAGAKRPRGGNNGSGSSSTVTKMELDSISSTKPPEPHVLLRAKEGKSALEVLAHGVDDMHCDDDDHEKKQPSSSSSHPISAGIINELLNSKPAASSPADANATKPTPPKRTGGGNKKNDPLVRQAELKDIHLLRMPNGMSRRNNNTTKFNKKKGIITWKVELCFHEPTTTTTTKGNTEDGGSKKVPKLLRVESEVSESTTLFDELGKHLDVHPGNSNTRTQLKTFTSATTSSNNNNKTKSSLLVYMKRLPCSSASPQYYKLDMYLTLLDNLKGKTIIEYPQMDVVLEEDERKFPLFMEEI